MSKKYYIDETTVTLLKRGFWFILVMVPLIYVMNKAYNYGYKSGYSENSFSSYTHGRIDGYKEGLTEKGKLEFLQDTNDSLLYLVNYYNSGKEYWRNKYYECSGEEQITGKIGKRFFLSNDSIKVEFDDSEDTVVTMYYIKTSPVDSSPIVKVY